MKILFAFVLPANIDLHALVTDEDLDHVTILQQVLAGVAFCSVEEEFGATAPPALAKVFRLAQIIIQYLLHSQERLTRALANQSSEQVQIQPFVANPGTS